MYIPTHVYSRMKALVRRYRQKPWFNELAAEIMARQQIEWANLRDNAAYCWTSDSAKPTEDALALAYEFVVTRELRRRGFNKVSDFIASPP